MVPRWVIVDKLVHELGSLRAVVQELESRPDLAEDDVIAELRSSLERAADTVHLVIGGNEGMVDKAWRCLADAKDAGTRARLAAERWAFKGTRHASEARRPSKREARAKA